MPATAEKMKSVKVAWDKAPAGAKPDAALMHSQPAEQALAEWDGPDCNRERDAVTQTLA